VALAHLVARLRAGGYRLLDTQFVTSHLETFGVEEVPREAFHVMLKAALQLERDVRDADLLPATEVVQLITQTS